ncbi:hypothetical protein FDF74_09210 [Clostridium niameyense]|uniref:Uncharacterized protein n=1 Tax=Clostridium niameyense TaxID=1622073 RepID=A0A6M0RCE8_9CLOT|nr:hypothetical protein [Clostridium niameyense]NEZ47370.1 hypothetical protein [Clostridium niameyense]
MNIIMVNKKRLGVTIIIIGLMLILCVFEKNFEGRLRITALIHNNISSFQEYKGLNGRLSYKLPSGWKTEEYNHIGSEIIYNNSFRDDKSGIHGFIQVWNYNGDLKSFLNHSKNISNRQNISYKEYSVNTIKINEKKGYMLQYTITGDYSNADKEDKEYRAYEYFIKDKDKFFRISFFMDDKDFQESITTVFETILQTFKYKK